MSICFQGHLKISLEKNRIVVVYKSSDKTGGFIGHVAGEGQYLGSSRRK